MTALTATRKIDVVAGGTSRYRVAKVAGDAVIYKGALIGRNGDGYVVPAANTAGLVIMGVAQQTVDATDAADGDYEVNYLTGVTVPFKNDGTNPVAQANLGLPVWVQDDQTVRGTPGNRVIAGYAESIASNGDVMVFVAPEEVLASGVRPYEIRYEHAQATVDATHKLDKVPAGFKFRLLSVDYINPTGLAQDAANYFNIKVLADAVVMANWSTLTGAQGTIAANTFVALVNSGTDADLVAAAGAIIALFLDETGDTTLPAGRIVIRGLLIPDA